MRTYTTFFQGTRFTITVSLTENGSQVVCKNEHGVQVDPGKFHPNLELSYDQRRTMVIAAAKLGYLTRMTRLTWKES